MLVDITDIKEGTRFREDLGDIAELENSIREHGIIAPLAVENTAEGFVLLAGGRRLQAAKNIGMTQVPIRIYNDLSEYMRRSIELEENIRRKDMSWQEDVKLKKEVHALRQKIHGAASVGGGGIQDKAWGLAETAELLQESVGGVSQDIKLAKALEAMPHLSEIKTKKEAQAVLKKMTRKMNNEHKAQQFDANNEDQDLKKLAKSYIIGDAIEMMKSLTAETFDLIEIDPPYGIDFARSAKTITQQVEREEYTEVADTAYIPFMLEVMNQAKRLVKEDGWILLWMPTTWFDLVQSLCTTLSLEVAVPAVWVKPTAPGNTMNPKYMLGSNYEPFFYIRKSAKATITRQGRRNIFIYDPPMSNRIHPTERPVDLMIDVLSTFAEPLDSILSPFLGSGNTLIAAHKAKMAAIGFDLSSSYRNAFIDRLSTPVKEATEESE